MSEKFRTASRVQYLSKLKLLFRRKKMIFEKSMMDLMGKHTTVVRTYDVQEAKSFIRVLKLASCL